MDHMWRGRALTVQRPPQGSRSWGPDHNSSMGCRVHHAYQGLWVWPDRQRWRMHWLFYSQCSGPLCPHWAWEVLPYFHPFLPPRHSLSLLSTLSLAKTLLLASSPPSHLSFNIWYLLPARAVLGPEDTGDRQTWPWWNL